MEFDPFSEPMEALTENEQALRVLRSLELIAHLDRTIHLHRHQPNSDAFMLAQYTDRRAKYLDQLAELMGKATNWKPGFGLWTN